LILLKIELVKRFVQVKAYDESLVRHGEILLHLRIVKGWKRELAEMNKGKEGAQYEYPGSLIRLLAFIHVYLRLPYRQLEGFTKMMARYVDGLKTPDYSSMAWRVQRLERARLLQYWFLMAFIRL
jgi:hypothetical protein